MANAHGIAPGTIGFAKIGGILGWVISFLQWLSGDGSKWTHVFIYIGEGKYGENTIFAAQPGGARYDDLSKLKEVAWLSMVQPTPEQFAIIKKLCADYEGAPYSYSNYLAIGLRRYFHVEWNWLRNYIKNSGRNICSQMADLFYFQAGIHLFNDGRWPQDVTPGSLADLAVSRVWTQWPPPVKMV